MPNIFHQSVEDILKAATPEQKILWNWVFLRFGERVPITQLNYVGLYAGSEFLTYSARKLYIAYNFSAGGGSTLALAAPVLDFYDENNAQHYAATNKAIVWDVTAAAVKYSVNQVSVNNIYFSRISGTLYTVIKFSGYRISI